MFFDGSGGEWSKSNEKGLVIEVQFRLAKYWAGKVEPFQDRLGPILEKYKDVFSEMPSKIQPFEAK